MHVGIVDDVHGFSGLWVEGSDLSVAPPADDALPVSHEPDAVALYSRHVDAEDLVPVLGVPYSDIVHRAGREHVAVSMREDHVVDLGVVARVPELGGETACVDPVDIAQLSTTEEVGVVSSEGDRGDSA